MTVCDRPLSTKLITVISIMGRVSLRLSQFCHHRWSTAAGAPKIPNDQLDSLVAPIALYPDPRLAQVLVASTYPLEIIQLQQFLDKNKDLKDKALTDAVLKEDWDASIQAMAVLIPTTYLRAWNSTIPTKLGA